MVISAGENAEPWIFTVFLSVEDGDALQAVRAAAITIAPKLIIKILSVFNSIPPVYLIHTASEGAYSVYLRRFVINF